MKKLITIFILLNLFTFGKAQLHYNKNGTPDMRYKENKALYGNPSYSLPSYNNESKTAQPTRSSKINEYPTTQTTPPSYSNPYTGDKSNTPSYPNKKDGTPDMRYKENRQIYYP